MPNSIEVHKIEHEQLGITVAGELSSDYFFDLVSGLLVDQQGVIDHGLIFGLQDDDHPQYALLAGRSGGQTINGGSDSWETLTIAGTSHSSGGYIKMQTGTGLVGIGNVTPQTKLHVKEDSADGYSATFENIHINDIDVEYGHGIHIKSSKAGVLTYTIKATNYNNTETWGYLQNSTANTFSVASVSDERLKENIKDSDIPALEKINELKVRQFNFKSSPDFHHKAGFIAQEVQLIIPEAVDYHKEDDLYTVSKETLIPYLVKSIQTLTSENKELSERLEVLEKKAGK